MNRAEARQKSGHPVALEKVALEAIDYVHRGARLPKDLNNLIDWYEDEGFETLLESWDDFGRVLNIRDLAFESFSDYDLIESNNKCESPSHADRANHGRQLISEAFEASGDLRCSSIHCLELLNFEGEKAILGWLVEVHGQSGPVPIFQGIFRDKLDFYGHLRSTGYVLDTEESAVTDEAILRLWQQPKIPVRTVKVTVDWGYDTYACSMSKVTWHRVVKGKLIKRIVPFYYEGKRYKATWTFNKTGHGSLLVTDADQTVRLAGSLSEATIIVDDLEVCWNDKPNNAT